MSAPVPKDLPTPSLLHQPPTDDRDLFWGVFWEWFGARLRTCAGVHFRRAGVRDPDRADDAVQRVVVKLLSNWSYDPDKGRLGPYLEQAVRNEVQSMLRDAVRHPGDFGEGQTEVDALAALEDRLAEGMRGLDVAWQQERRRHAEAAVAATRARVAAHEWEAFSLVYLDGLPAAEAAAAINARRPPGVALKPAQIYPMKNKVRRYFVEELGRAGLNLAAANPDTLFPVLRDALVGPSPEAPDGDRRPQP